jgi:2-aminobenzoate-CoA ligase
MLHIFVAAADDDIRPGSTGIAVPGYRAAVVNSAGQPVPDGDPGRLAVKGPTGCRYLNDERQGSYVQGGWNLTGDTYVRDSDGYFWYQARSDDMIISGGYNIAGPEIEEVLLSHPDVAECGVVGIPDEARGQIVKAFVILRAGADGGEDKARELQDLVKQKIAPYKYPRAIEFVAALPRTNTGKLQRFLLRNQDAPAG